MALQLMQKGMKFKVMTFTFQLPDHMGLVLPQGEVHGLFLEVCR